MRNLITILFVVFLATSCHRKTIPDSTFQYTTSIVQKDSVVVEDTTINIPAKEVSLELMIDTLLSEQKRLQAEKKDTAIYESIKMLSFDSTVKQHNNNLSASIFLNSAGWLKFTCHEDSLKQVISNLSVAYAQLYVTKQQTKIVPGPVQIKTQIPSWMWWWFGISLIYLIFKVGLLTFTPATGATGILKLLLSIFK